MSAIHSILKRYWDYDTFRPQQEEIIQSVLSGRDTLALLPTGGGKSICYQVPALALDGICIVVSPLIALMKDQVENLKKRGVGALVIFSGMNRKDIIRTLENARSDYFKFLYVSPERLETSLFLEYLPALNINLIAVDEAHCISQWGYDFRPSYQRIVDLRKEIPGVPVLAVTATATAEVQKDICEKLTVPVTFLKERKEKKETTWNVFRQSFERKNLSFSVFKVDSKINKLVKIVKNVPGSGIVYCKSRKRTTEISQLLRMHGIIAAHYHAGLPQEERTLQQQEWVINKTRVIVCTNAFGMGIDKPDVRFVVHVDMPDCLENYYQEAGRCGRDGKKAFAVLLYDEQDIKELQNLHLTRYPTFEQIQKVYSSLVSFLQISVNTGQDVSYDFRFEDFIRNFKLNVQTALYSLKALEQDGWIVYNEKSFMPSTIVFTTSKEVLYDFYKDHPELEELSTFLLRTYDGIFDFPSFISEYLLSSLVKLDISEVKQQLHRLSSLGIINYTPQSDFPQLIFKKNRVATEDLKIDMTQHEKRREIFNRRVNKIIDYTSAVECRSRNISQYFGDQSVPECQICDNCLQKKIKDVSDQEFEDISTSIMGTLQQNMLTPEQIIQRLQFSKTKIWKVLLFLQKEKKISVDGRGCFYINRP